jgi:GT2 family glycosyltransferase
MTLDVIVVNFESAPLIPGCLAAVRAFAGDTARVVVVDNSPYDGAAEAARAAFPGASVIENAENAGFARAVNQGLTATEGDVVLLLNPDITAIRGDFAELRQTFESDARVAAVTPRLVDESGSWNPSCRAEPRPFDLVSEWLDLSGRYPRWRRPRRFRMLDMAPEVTRDVDSATGACLFLRRAAIEDVGLFDEAFFLYWEETDWLVRAKQKGWRMVYLPSLEAVHAGSRSTRVPDELLGLLLAESQHRYAGKHFGRPVAAALRGTLLTLDALRWIRHLGAAGTTERHALVRRMRVHLTGRAPRPVRSTPAPRAA